MKPTRLPFVAFLCVGALVAVPVTIVRAVHPVGASDDAPLTLDDIAFMAGRWQAEHDGGRLEEHFTAADHGTMIGMFRWMSDGATGMTEHMVIEQRENGVHFLLRHFGPGSEPWASEADGPMDFTLVESRDGRAVFEVDRRFPRHLVYHFTKPDRLDVRLEGRTDAGDERVMEFNFRSMNMTTSPQMTEAAESMGYDGGLTLAFQVKDLSASMDWYQNVLGFSLQYHMEEMGWCELVSAVPGVNVGLSQVESPKPGGPTPTWGVKDIDAARSRLEGLGVKFDGPTQEIPDMVKLATFYDPDGNSLMLYQTLGEAP